MPRMIGRFRVIRRLGSGGFGVVFLAEDPVLQRFVALKIPRPETLATADLQRRFVRESQIAAKLNHSHLVSVFEAGQAGTVSYQVTAYCSGGSLASWLCGNDFELPASFESHSHVPQDSVAFLAAVDNLKSAEACDGVTITAPRLDAIESSTAQAAAFKSSHQRQLPISVAVELMIGLVEGVRYAHEHGILHRDLKPSNVLLQPKSDWNTNKEFDVVRTVPLERLCIEFQPMIADFGLAKLFEDAEAVLVFSNSADDKATPEIVRSSHSTTIAGTPQYMAPEQFEGRVAEIGPATDIYALGAILYEVLTGRPVFAKNSLQALHVQAASQAPRPLRQLRAEIPPDLEAICLKCLAKPVSHRYGAAQDLLDDLQAFRRGEAVAARPWPWHENLLRWSQRRPAVASLLAICGLLFAALLGFGAWHLARLERLNTELLDLVGEKEWQTQLATEASLRADGLATLAQEQSEAAIEGRRRAESLALEARHREYASGVLRAAQHFGDDNTNLMSEALRDAIPAPDSAMNTTIQTDDLRGFEWRYLWHQSRNYRELAGHTDSAVSAMLTPNGQSCYSVGRDGTVRHWNVATLRLLNTWSLGDAANDYRVRMTPDSSRAIIARQLLARDASEIIAWDFSAGREIQRIELPGRVVHCVEIAADGNWAIVAGTERNQHRPMMAFWDLRSGALQNQARAGIINSSAVEIESCALTSDARDLVVLWNSPGPTSWNSAIQHLALKFPETHSGITGHALPIIGATVGGTEISEGVGKDLRFSADGHLLVASTRSPAKIEVFKWPELQSESRTNDLPDLADSVAFGPSGKSLGLGLVFPGKSTAPVANADISVGIGPSRPALQFWDHQSNEQAASEFPASVGILSLEYHAPSSTWVIGENGGRICLWRREPIVAFAELPGHQPSEAWSLAFSADGKTLYTAGDDACVRAWDVESRRPLAVGAKHTQLISCVAVSPDGAWIATGSYDDDVILWNAETLVPSAVLKGHIRDIRTLAFSPDSKLLASAGRDCIVRLWNVAAGTLSHSCAYTEGGTIRGLAFLDNERFLLANAEGQIISQTVGGQGMVQRTEPDEIHCLAATPLKLSLTQVSRQVVSQSAAGNSDAEGHRAIVVGRKFGTFRLVPCDINESWLERCHHGVDIRTADFSPDGRTLAVAGDDQAVHLWNVATGQELLRFSNLPAAANHVAFAPDGQTLAAALHDGTIRLWYAPRTETH